MRRIDRTLFEDAAAELSPDVPALEIHDAYAGRGMYGTKCIGVAGNLPAAMAFAFNLGLAAEQQDAWDLEDLIGDAAWDSMGTDVIVYFPGWHFTDESSQ